MVDLGEVQNAYNITLRDDKDALRFCADRDIPHVPSSPSDRPSWVEQGRWHNTRGSRPSPPSTPPRKPRSPSPGFCTAMSTSCSSGTAGRIALDDQDLAALDGVIGPESAAPV
jgi:hypothetical protein